MATAIMIAAAAPSGPVTVTHEYFGRDGSTGVEHELVSLRNASGLSASFTTFGAQLVSCAVPSRDGCVEVRVGPIVVRVSVYVCACVCVRVLMCVRVRTCVRAFVYASLCPVGARLFVVPMR